MCDLKMEVSSRKFFEFNTYEEAAKAAEGYNSSTLEPHFTPTERSVVMSNATRPIFPGHGEAYTASLLSAASGCDDDELNIVDVGGSDGLHYGMFRRYYRGKKKINWHIVETKIKVEYGKKYIKDEDIFFHEDVSDIKINKCNIFTAFGSLQYIEKFPSLMSDDLFRNADAVVLNATHCCEGVEHKPFLQDTVFQDRRALYPGKLVAVGWFIQQVRKTHDLDSVWMMPDEGWVTDRGTKVDSFGAYAVKR